MAKERQRAPWGDTAPRLAEITDTVLFGEVWRRKGLSQRDRSLITVACLIRSTLGKRSRTVSVETRSSR